MSEILDQLPSLGLAHLRLCVAVLLAAALVSAPLCVLALRHRRLETLVLGVASIVQTIPGLALLAVMVPLLAFLGTSSIGFLPAFLGLVAYALLPILRNSIVGVRSIDPAVIEAARGVGMTPTQQLRLVELPLAVPMIIAGFRIATVWTVGTATLATPVGAHSLGNLIFSGLQTRNHLSVLVGCVAASLLALLLDGLIRNLEGGVAGTARLRRRIAAVGLVGLGLISLLAPGLGRDRGHERSVRIGAKTFTEQYILSELLRHRIEGRGLGTEVVASLGSSVVFDALRNGELDVYVDYSGTLWANVLKREDLPPRAQLNEELAAELQTRFGIVVVGRLGFENAYAIAVQDHKAKAAGWETIEDLAPVAPQLEIGGDYEFFSRPEWKRVRDSYGLRFAGTRSMDSGLMYQTLASAEVDAISAFSSDGRIAAYELRVLKDPRAAIPPYDALILTREEILGEEEGLRRALAPLVGAIDLEAMQQMNREVDIDGKSARATALNFARKQGL